MKVETLVNLATTVKVLIKPIYIIQSLIYFKLEYYVLAKDSSFYIKLSIIGIFQS
jgi:hypothetical protein